MKVAAIAVIAFVVLSAVGAPWPASSTALATSAAPPLAAPFDCDSGYGFAEEGCRAIRAAYEAAAKTVAEIGHQFAAVAADPVWRTFRHSLELQSRVWLRSLKARVLGVGGE